MIIKVYGHWLDFLITLTNEGKIDKPHLNKNTPHANEQIQFLDNARYQSQKWLSEGPGLETILHLRNWRSVVVLLQCIYDNTQVTKNATTKVKQS